MADGVPPGGIARGVKTAPVVAPAAMPGWNRRFALGQARGSTTRRNRCPEIATSLVIRDPNCQGTAYSRGDYCRQIASGTQSRKPDCEMRCQFWCQLILGFCAIHCILMQPVRSLSLCVCRPMQLDALGSDPRMRTPGR